MFSNFMRPKNISRKMMRVVFFIYLAVTLLITSAQFFTEYIKTKGSILKELEQLSETVRGPVSNSLWQFDRDQVDVLVAGLLKMPIIEGVDIFDQDSNTIISKMSYTSSSIPLSIFDIQSDLTWTLNEERLFLGSLVLHSSSEVVLDRVLFGFSLIVITEIIKLSILFWLFVWAFDRYLAKPLQELMSQVDEVQLSQNISKRIKLSNTEDNEIRDLQEHMNHMLSAMERAREQLLDDEQAKRAWLESAVEKRTEELQILNDRLKELATIDSLTGVLNRGGFFDAAQHLLTLVQRQKKAASFVLMDLDYFKTINDTYGHFVGDRVLVHFTSVIQKSLRKSDLIGRVGGEEFAIFLPETGIEDAFQVAEKIRKAISCSTLDIDGESINYTVSLGVVSSEPQEQSVIEIFKRADLKLYDAKEKGRDHVER